MHTLHEIQSKVHHYTTHLAGLIKSCSNRTTAVKLNVSNCAVEAGVCSAAALRTSQCCKQNLQYTIGTSVYLRDLERLKQSTRRLCFYSSILSKLFHLCSVKELIYICIPSPMYCVFYTARGIWARAAGKCLFAYSKTGAWCLRGSLVFLASKKLDMLLM